MAGLRTEIARHHFLADVFALFRRYGYAAIPQPTVEAAAPYTRTTGEDFRNLMFLFKDPGNAEVCLRSEWTLATATSLLSAGCRFEQPQRVAYAGPVFRYRSEDGAGLQETEQMGVELLGPVDEDRGNLEILELATRVLGSAPLRHRDGIALWMNDLQVLQEMVTLIAGDSLPEPFPRGLLLSGRLEGLLNAEPPTTSRDQDRPILHAARALSQANQDETRQMVEDLIFRHYGEPRGVRTAAEIAEEIVKREATDSLRIDDRAKEQLRAFVQLSGDVESVLTEARKLLGDAFAKVPSLQRLAEQATLLQTITGSELPVNLDLGLRRGIRYYTGLIFEVRGPDGDGGTSRLLGGGRYDALLQALGTTDRVPAVGFSFNVQRLLERLQPEVTPPTLTFTLTTSRREEPLSILRRLRDLGWIALEGHRDETKVHLEFQDNGFTLWKGEAHRHYASADALLVDLQHEDERW